MHKFQSPSSPKDDTRIREIIEKDGNKENRYKMATIHSTKSGSKSSLVQREMLNSIETAQTCKSMSKVNNMKKEQPEGVLWICSHPALLGTAYVLAILQRTDNWRRGKTFWGSVTTHFPPPVLPSAALVDQRPDEAAVCIWPGRAPLTESHKTWQCSFPFLFHG